MNNFISSTNTSTRIDLPSKSSLESRNKLFKIDRKTSELDLKVLSKAEGTLLRRSPNWLMIKKWLLSTIFS